MTHLSDGVSISQTKDELRDRFVSKQLETKLIANHACDVKDPFNLGLDRDWQDAVLVRREEYRDRETGRRVALIYWTKDQNPELIINSLVDEGVRYFWNGVPATKDWSTYSS